MFRTLIVLPDGTELSSGVGEENAIQSVTITECVNGAQELTLGSCCANMVEAKVLTPSGGLPVAAGDEIIVYRVANDGTRHKVGLFTTEKPTRPSANTLSLTAYDRVSWLDKDLTQWLAGLAEWPYSLSKLAWMVCAECGLELLSTEFPNGEHLVRQFSADGITGRQLIQWIGEAAGRFCRATPDGFIEFAWYRSTPCVIAATANSAVVYDNGNLIITDPHAKVDYADGELSISSNILEVDYADAGNLIINAQMPYYYQNSLSFEDYCVAGIEKVQIKQGEDDVGTVYPDIAESVNTYIINNNCLLTAESADDLKPVAQTLYEQLKDVSYTPCKVSIPAKPDLHAGDIVQVTDINGKSITVFVMTKTTAGQRDTLECTGSHKRDSVAAVNSQTFKALHGKVLNLRSDVEGIKVENKDTQGKVASLQLDVNGIRSDVSKATEMDARVSKVEQKAESLNVSIQNIQKDGVSKVKSEFGLTIDESAVHIHRSGSEMTNKLNENGMYVVRDEGKSNETVMLQADAKGVIATDVSVRSFLVIGNYARFENYSNGADNKRTACFWLGG